MKDKSTIYKLGIIVLVIIIGVLLFFNYKQSININKYKNAIQDPLNKIIVRLTNNMDSPATEKLLQDSIINKKMSSMDADLLTTTFMEISSASQDLNNITVYVGGTANGTEFNNKTSLISQDIADYIRKNIINKYKQDHLEYTQNFTIKLNKDQITKLKSIQKINESWKQILNRNISNKYELIKIDDHSWMNLAKELSQYSSKLN